MMYVLLDDCLGCGACEDVCPYNAIIMSDQVAYIDREKCICCGECCVACPADAINDDGNGFYDFDSDFDMDLFGDSEDFWDEVPYLTGGASTSGVDCSHLVWLVYGENGLPYDMAVTAWLADDYHFFQVEFPVDGDLILWPGHHVGIYIENPPIAGRHIWSATEHGGVRYGRISWWSDIHGNPIYLRYKK